MGRIGVLDLVVKRLSELTGSMKKLSRMQYRETTTKKISVKLGDTES